MAIIKCKMCGGDIILNGDKTLGTCDSCGSTMTFPKVSDEQRAAAFNRGNHFRRSGEFDKALAVYEHIISEDDTDAEAHWCCALSRFGVEYVEDPTTYEYLPTLHRLSYDNFLQDVDYLAALEHSDGVTKRQYQKDAAKIEEVQKGILATTQNAEPFDVFICYKETDEGGQRTRDSLMAQDVYYQLTEQGFRVFFARITLEDVVGTQYEPYIFAALNSAKVMVTIGTKAEHFNAVWVKNEWSRFLALMKRDHSKVLLPCYRDMDPYDLPEGLSVLQSYDMSKIGFIQDLIRGIKKVLAAEKPVVEKETVVIQSASANANTAALLERAFIFLEDGKWREANEYCEKALDQDPKNATAYLGKLMANLRVSKKQDLPDHAKPFDDNEYYQKILRFGDDKLKEEVQGYVKHIKERNEHDRLEGIYTTAVNSMKIANSEMGYNNAAGTFAQIKGYRDADALEKQCREKAEQCRKDELYQRAINQARSDTKNNYKQAIELLESIPQWKDADTLVAKYQARISELQAAEEQAELERQRQAEQRRIEIARREKKKKTLIIFFSAAAVVAIAVAVLMTRVIIPSNEYNSAMQLMENGQYDEASAAFEDLGKYKDAPTQVYAAQYAEGVALLAAGDYDGATQAFTDAGDYSDASTQITECQYQKANALNAAGSYDEAYSVFDTIRGYKDVDTIIETDENIAAAAEYLAQFTVGNTVTFGNYEGEPIEWLVLAEEGNDRVMIAVKGQDAVCFNKSASDGNEWESSYVRTWLNDTFYNSAFSDEEKAMITAGPTDDNVWLLSVEEAEQYFASDDDRICYPTQTALDHGVWTNDSGACRWWLRSSGDYSNYAACVYADGYIGSRGFNVINRDDSVRPVVVLRLF